MNTLEPGSDLAQLIAKLTIGGGIMGFHTPSETKLTPSSATDALMVFVVTMLCLGCFSGSNGSIPITTSSEQARQYYVTGRELDECLRRFEAAHYFNKALALDSNFALAYLALAALESSMPERMRLLNKAITLGASASEGERLLIRAYQANLAGNRKTEQKHLRALTALYPEDERALTMLGNSLLNAGDYRAAIKHYERAIKLNPQYSPVYNQLGYANSYLEQYDAAEQAFLKYIELIPDDPNPYDSYAELQLRKGNFAKSLEYYQKALKKNPYFFPAYGGVSSVYNFLGDYDEARIQIRTLDERARTAEHHRLAMYGMAVSYADQGNLDSALVYLRQSSALADRANDLLGLALDLNSMAEVHLAAGRSSKALSLIHKARKKIEQSPMADRLSDRMLKRFHQFAIRAAIQDNDLTKARYHLKKLDKVLARSDGLAEERLRHELAGLIALAEKDAKTAIRELEAADLRSPSNLWHLADAYELSGSGKRAEELRIKALTSYIDNNLEFSLLRATAKDYSILAQQGD